ncbi:MAG: hypothetical protein AB4290_25010 [Spirulina sp.]
MKDSETLFVKAFLYALSQQKTQLSEELQAEIGAIFASLETRFRELTHLALETPSLKNAYQNAELWLDSTDAKHRGGLKFLPLYDPHDDGMGETANITDDPTKAIAQMEKVLEIIDRDYEDAAQTISQPNPIQTLQQFIANRLNQ